MEEDYYIGDLILGEVLSMVLDGYCRNFFCQIIIEDLCMNLIMGVDFNFSMNLDFWNLIIGFGFILIKDFQNLIEDIFQMLIKDIFQNLIEGSFQILMEDIFQN